MLLLKGYGNNPGEGDRACTHVRFVSEQANPLLVVDANTVGGMNITKATESGNYLLDGDYHVSLRFKGDSLMYNVTGVGSGGVGECSYYTYDLYIRN
jgi:hypothetical protein